MFAYCQQVVVATRHAKDKLMDLNWSKPRPRLRFQSCDFEDAPVNTSARQCASTSIDSRAVPRGRPPDRCRTAAVLAGAKSASVFQGMDQRSKTLDEVRALLRHVSRLPLRVGAGNR